MSDLVTSIDISSLVSKLKSGEYLVPRFQREFVWSTADIVALLNSVVDSHPIGMMTLWEQPDDSGLELEHVSLPDSDVENGNVSYFGNPNDRTNKTYAILDGRQRSTAIAMAFGGLSANTKKRQPGKFFLNVLAAEPIDRVVFKSSQDIEKAGLDTLATCISEGLFPFELEESDGSDVGDRWRKYAREIIDPRFYKGGILPDQVELDRRIAILDAAVKGVTETLLAIYIVPKRFDLGTICEIFETLNTTGTKVSTVDLIHSWLYSDTRQDTGGATRLREWIRELGQYPGANGWADPEDRPELIAQFVTATYISEKNPSAARKVGGKVSPVSSVKASDLLATPTEHWKDVIGKTEEFSVYIGDFQKCVARNQFSMRASPYPISAAIYIGLRWTNKVDARGWKIDALDALYRAFFWRNSLSSRYDQGFLTKMATDLKLLADILDDYDSSSNFGEWATAAIKAFDQNEIEAVSQEDLVGYLLGPKPAGALGKALVLPLLTRPKYDVLEPMKSISMGSAAEAVEVHHLFPRAWVRDNVPSVLLEQWRAEGRGTVESVANLTPMLRSSNAKWKAKAPGKALTDSGVAPATHAQVLESHLLGGEIFRSLVDQADGLPSFWQQRASALAAELGSRMVVQG